MGQVYADIELINAGDMALARSNGIHLNEVKRISMHARVETDSFYMAINENIQKVLQLRPLETKLIKLADGQMIVCDLVGYLEIQFEDCTAYCTAIVLPEDSEPILGRRPLQEMNVLIDSQQQKLVKNPKPFRI